MPRFRPPPDDLLAKAAELRAAGTAWDAVAAAVGRAAETVRKWPTLYAAKWRGFHRRAERQLLAEATAESVHTLRRHLRSADEKVSRDAADRLIRYRVAAGGKARAKSKSAGPSAAAVRFAAYLEGLSDADLDQLIADLSTRRADRPAAGGGAA